MADRYDVVIVGGGPAGMFAALELTRASHLRVLLLEKGRELEERRCPARQQSRPCIACQPCNLVCGLGGAGAFSDGKLTLSSEVGGNLADYVGTEATAGLIQEVDATYRHFGAPDRLYGVGPGVDELGRKAARVGLHLKPMPVRHLGTEHCRLVLHDMWEHLRPRVDVRTGTVVADILADDGRVCGLTTGRGEVIECHYLVVAPGREGAGWLAGEAERLHLTVRQNPVDVGVRVEVPSAVMQEFCDILYEGKLEYISPTFRDRVRTFCMCPGGEVIVESTGGADPVITVNGHSYAGHSTENTNFALLVSTTFTEPFHEPEAYGKYLARLANLLAGGVLVQRLGDLMQGHRSTPERLGRGGVRPTLASATPGDLSFALPYRHLTGLVEMLGAMQRLIPGVSGPDTLLYGVEVKFYSNRLQLSPVLETGIANLFAAGDGAGVSRGLIQASASGVVVAREILRRAA